MPAIPAIALVVAAAGATYSAVSANQQVQHAKGAAQAQATAAQAQVDAQAKSDQATQVNKGQGASATQSAAIQALRASLSANNSFGGSLLTGGQGTGTPAPTATKSLLGA